MRFDSILLKALPLTALAAAVIASPVEAETPACTHGTALLQTDAQAWLSLQNQMARLKTNVTKLRTEITDVIDINVDIGEASKTAYDIHKTLSLIAPLFELAPSLQSGLEKTARAAEISHKSVLNPVHNVTDTIVTKAKLHEIRAEIDTKVLPNIGKYEGEASKAHTQSVKFGSDYIKACHIAATIQKTACISAANKDIDAVYNTFNKPVGLLNTAVLDIAKGVGDANRIMETSLAVSFKPVLDIHRPVVDISKVIRELEHEIEKLERDMKKHIHIHIGAFHFKFTIKHLLKEWKHELKKLEHLVNVDKLKEEMRKEVEKVLHPIVHAIEKFIHTLEREMTPPGMNMGALEADFRALEKMFDLKGPDFDLSAIEKAIHDIENAIRELESCK
ncbi:MAG: hypothetical protein ACFE0S_17505 [Rhodospirillales bacterium]